PLSNGSATLTVAGANAGDHLLSVTYAAQGDFASSSATATLHVNPRAIMVTADAQVKTYGSADPVLSYHVSNGSLASGDSFTGTLVRDGGEAVGSDAIHQGTLALGSNYILTFAGANLTIGARAASVTPNATGKA